MSTRFHFTPGRRLKAVRGYAWLTSTLVILGTILWLLALLVTAISWAVLAFGELGHPLFGAILFTAGLFGASVSVVIYAFTYFPSAASPRTLSTLDATSPINVATTASFSLLHRIGRYMKQGSAESLAASLPVVVATYNVQQVLLRLNLAPEHIQSLLLTHVVSGITWDELAQGSLQVAVQLGANEVTELHVFGAWLLHPRFKTVLRTINLREEDLKFTLWWQGALSQAAAARRRWWDEKNLLAFTGVGLAWTAGYTPMLDQFARLPKGNLWDAIPYGRAEQIDQVIVNLARQRQSNVLVVGQPGVGRLAIIRELARRINASQAHPVLNGQRLVYVHVGELTGVGDTSAGQTSFINQVLREMERAGNIIAVLDGLSSILGQSGEQRLNMTDVLLPFFSSQTVRTIVIVSAEEYHLRLVNNQELLHTFEVVQVPPLSEEDTLHLLALMAPVVERRTRIWLPYHTLVAIVDGTSSILPQIPFPERAFDVLEEALVVAQQQQVTTLTVENVNRIISQKIGMNIGQLQAAERTSLLGLEDLMHKRVVNQARAVQTVARAMIRARAGVRNKKRPIGTFLFLGPTGVGKTETAKTLAEAHFNSEDAMIRLDMSEFNGDDAPGRLIGTPAQPSGRLTTAVADRPFSVVLLDEFEKASPDVHQLFLQVFDEGFITNVRGQKIVFSNTILIATSNAGAEFIRQQVAAGPLPEKFDEQLRDHVLESGIFRPELLNRFDAIITFTPLSQEHLRQVATIMLTKLNNRLDDTQGVTVALTADLIDYLIEIGYNPQFGARPMARAIQDTVEYVMAQRIIREQIEPGQVITLTSTELRAINR